MKTNFLPLVCILLLISAITIQYVKKDSPVKYACTSITLTDTTYTIDTVSIKGNNGQWQCEYGKGQYCYMKYNIPPIH